MPPPERGRELRDNAVDKSALVRIGGTERDEYSLVGTGDIVGRVDATRAADGAVRIIRGVFMRRAVEVVRRRVIDRRRAVRRLAQVPDADVVREGVVAVERLAALGRTPVHHELGSLRHRRELDPDERRAGRVPCVDVVGERRAVRREKSDVVAGRGEHQVVIVEPGDRRLADAHENGEVGECLAVGIIAVHGEHDTPREAIWVMFKCVEVDRGLGGE